MVKIVTYHIIVLRIFCLRQRIVPVCFCLKQKTSRKFEKVRLSAPITILLDTTDFTFCSKEEQKLQSWTKHFEQISVLKKSLFSSLLLIDNVENVDNIQACLVQPQHCYWGEGNSKSSQIVA